MAEQSFKVLGLPHNATVEQIKKQYRVLAKRLHPDRIHIHSSANAGDFIKVSTAYEDIMNAKSLINESQGDMEDIERIREQYLKEQKKKERDLWHKKQKETERKHEIRTAQIQMEAKRKLIRDENKFCYKPWKNTKKCNPNSIGEKKRQKEKHEARLAFKRYFR